MLRRLALLVGSPALVALLSLPAAAGHNQFGCAIASPLDSPDGPPTHYKGVFVPYYGSPLTPISTRWRTVVYVPYYCGYCRPHHVQGLPYGSDDGSPGCAAETMALVGQGGFGPYTGAPTDTARFVRIGGNAPYVPSAPGAVDLVDILSGGGPNGGVPNGGVPNGGCSH